MKLMGVVFRARSCYSLDNVVIYGDAPADVTPTSDVHFEEEVR